MLWHYNCPQCGQELEVRWEALRNEVTCPTCAASHYPPTPGEDHYAWIDAESPPREIEDIVVALRGTTCVVPSCYADYSTLVHRRPRSAGGRTSVDNLIPLCDRHARLKGEQVYEEWVAALKEEPAGETPFDITFTHSDADERAAAPPGPVDPGRVLAAGAEPPRLAENMTLLTVTGFRARPAARLALRYRWRLGAGGPARVLLVAWPEGSPPDLTGSSGEQDVVTATAVHPGDAVRSGTDEINLTLPPDSSGLWSVAALAADDGGKPVVETFLLAERP